MDVATDRSNSSSLDYSLSFTSLVCIDPPNHQSNKDQSPHDSNKSSRPDSGGGHLLPLEFLLKSRPPSLGGDGERKSNGEVRNQGVTPIVTRLDPPKSWCRGHHQGRQNLWCSSHGRRPGFGQMALPRSQRSSKRALLPRMDLYCNVVVFVLSTFHLSFNEWKMDLMHTDNTNHLYEMRIPSSNKN
ncbi:hypothetical protein J1N35_018378 [Gossypium stocksii]|uniref:Uncharacterized protein n=1 Tax=Gossypium stocksii TaxID=47602 RepID=A0A9D4A761_9ROSI|nr:hypothetical protein J1N35_018378 [Gossypium stocksii]